MKIDLLTTTLEELGLSDLTLEELAAAEKVCLEQHVKIAGGRPWACIAPTSLVADVLDQLIVLTSRRHIYRLLGRSAYADLVAELDSLRLVPARWGLGVEAA